MSTTFEAIIRYVDGRPCSLPLSLLTFNGLKGQWSILHGRSSLRVCGRSWNRIIPRLDCPGMKGRGRGGGDGAI